MENAPASQPLIPARITTSEPTATPATPAISARLETTPSLKPKSEARKVPDAPTDAPCPLTSSS